MLCHTGLVWERWVDGRELHFRLGGINHQNFLMSDEETGSWWQQVSGECILGPLKGKRLRRVPSDELTLAAWRAEQPGSTIVRFDARYLHRYQPSDWEQRVAGIPTVGVADGILPPRALIAGVEHHGEAAAYPLDLLRRAGSVPHILGGRPVVVLLGPDGKSVRAFERLAAGRELDLYREAGGSPLWIDAQTGSRWDFTGRAVSGPLAGSQLPKLQTSVEYWFDWKRYHPRTRVYRAGR
jgi:hypothetical protein